MPYMSLDDLLMMGTFCQIVEDLQRVHRTLDEHGRILRRLENYAAGLGIKPKPEYETCYQESLSHFQKRKKKGLPASVIEEIKKSQKKNSGEDTKQNQGTEESEVKETASKKRRNRKKKQLSKKEGLSENQGKTQDELHCQMSDETSSGENSKQENSP
ncbi:unnamed protein product [Bemisia tabaci]|uniref:Uncharacterized protein n=1 Tax=Bemisia tabaci TaxID=7038 RepID=A0A9P0F205_BEMTA|nr:PREDICTED: uncharacterized protein LOC109039639 [Bemisia tabaci]CAH0385557.1 unnamed protein product [Bemisia tabaci]